MRVIDGVGNISNVYIDVEWWDSEENC